MDKFGNKSLLAVIVGVLIATLVVVYSVYSDLTKTYAGISLEIQDQHQQRILQNTMHQAARERSLTLLAILAEKDRVVLDELNQTLRVQAAKYIGVRTELMEYDLDQPINELLDQQLKASHEVATLQNHAAQLLLDGNRDAANDILFKQVLPSQNKALVKIKQATELYDRNSNALITSRNRTLEKSSHNFVAVASVFITISILTLLMLVNRISKKEEKFLQHGVAEQKRALKQLVASSDKLRQYMDALATFTVMLAPNGKIILVNSTAVAATGQVVDYLTGKYFHECYWWNYDPEIQNDLLADIKACAKGRRIDREVDIQVAGGEFITIRFILTPVKDRYGSVTELVAEGQDITERKAARKELTHQASHDALTGLINRTEFEQRVENVLGDRNNNTRIHYIFHLGLDNFKVINDTSGHAAGDELLKQVTTKIQACIRQSDALARLSGDEFGLILENCDAGAAMRVANSIIQAVREHDFSWHSKAIQVGISIGAVVIDSDLHFLGETMKRLDSACDAAKEEGGNRYHVYMATDQALVQRESEMDWISHIDTVLREDRFMLLAQPIVPVVNEGDQKNSFELLIRIRERDGRIILPCAFLSAAERYNKVVDIDRWVCDEAFAVLEGNQEFVDSIDYCSINLSSQSLVDKEFMEDLFDKLSVNDTVPGKICFEISEGATTSNLPQAVKSMAALRKLGVRFALDNFGNGLSSLGYLKSLPLDYLKIDGLFVKGIATDTVDYAMVKSMHEVATVTGLITIAEFVENEEILEELERIGVPYAQGYGIGKPKPLSDVIEHETEQRKLEELEVC